MSSILADQQRPSYMSPNAGEGEGAGPQPMRTAVHITWYGAQINFGDLTPYLTHGHRYWETIVDTDPGTCIAPGFVCPSTNFSLNPIRAHWYSTVHLKELSVWLLVCSTLLSVRRQFYWFSGDSNQAAALASVWTTNFGIYNLFLRLLEEKNDQPDPKLILCTCELYYVPFRFL